MKTAMQELRDDLIQIFNDNNIPIILKIDKYLEKEKEQIIDAYADGIDHDYTDLDIEFGIADSDRQNHTEKYYNQTYNQNEG
jgi:hypothetical protein